MKKIFIAFFFIIICSSYANSQPFHSLHFKALSGEVVNLKDYAGKKVLFYVIPFKQSDSAFTELKAFKSRYRDTVQVIGILSIEDGFQSSKAAEIKNLYKDLDVVLSEGMNTRKAAGKTQSLLLNWLTDKNKNHHYNMDAMGVGHIFFVNGSGRLYAVLPPKASLQHPIINKIVHSRD